MRIISTDSQENMLFSPDIIDLPQPDDWGDFIRAIWVVSTDRVDKKKFRFVLLSTLRESCYTFHTG